MLHHSSVQLHHSSVQFCTICQFNSAPFIGYSSAPFISSVLYHSSATVLHHLLATIMRHLFMLFYNSASTNNLATDANTLSRQFSCISEILVPATAAYRIFALPVDAFILVKIQLHYTSFKSMFCRPAAELLVNTI